MRGTQNHKAQSSMEYMVIVGFAFLLVIPIVVLFYSNLHDMQDDVYRVHFDSLAQKIVKTADKVFYIGEPAVETIKVEFPIEVETMEILADNSTLRIQYRNADEVLVPVYWQSVAPLQGTFQLYDGIHYIRIEARSTHVLITDAS